MRSWTVHRGDQRPHRHDGGYGLTGIDRKVLPLYQGQYDVRWLVMCMKKMLDTDQLTMKDLPEFNPFTLKKDIQSILNFVNATPTISWDDPELY